MRRVKKIAGLLLTTMSLGWGSSQLSINLEDTFFSQQDLIAKIYVAAAAQEQDNDMAFYLSSGDSSMSLDWRLFNTFTLFIYAKPSWEDEEDPFQEGLTARAIKTFNLTQLQVDDKTVSLNFCLSTSCAGTDALEILVNREIRMSEAPIPTNRTNFNGRRGGIAHL